MTFQAVARRHRCPDCTGRIHLERAIAPQSPIRRLDPRSYARSANGLSIHSERRESGARRSVVPSVIVAAFVLVLAALEGAVPRLAAWVASWLP